MAARLSRAGAAAGAALALAAAGAAGCGGGSGGGAHAYGTYSDCARVGPLTTVRDPARDQAGALAGAPAQPQGDLLALRLARGHGELCFELRARGPIVPAAAYVLALRPPGARSPVVEVEATVLAAEPPRLLIDTGGGDAFRTLDGDVGIRGDRLSVLVGRSRFQALGVERAFDAFRFQLRSAVLTRDDGRLTDCMPDCR